MIQRRWRQRRSDESGSYDGSHDDFDMSAAENSSKKRSKRLQRRSDSSNDDRGDDSTTTTSCSNDSNTTADLSLLFRRNSNSSSISTMISRHYSQLQFLSASSGGSGDVFVNVSQGTLDETIDWSCELEILELS